MIAFRGFNGHLLLLVAEKFAVHKGYLHSHLISIMSDPQCHKVDGLSPAEILFSPIKTSTRVISCFSEDIARI